jgi:hypothetical protein
MSNSTSTNGRFHPNMSGTTLGAVSMHCTHQE